MPKIRTETTADNSIAVIFPAETLLNLGILPGDEVDVTAAENSLILRSVEEAERRRKLQAATEKVFSRWNNVFVELAKGTDADR